MADLKFGLICAFAVFPAGDGFRRKIADWVIDTKEVLGLGPIQLGRHRAMSKGMVNNLMNHQGVRHARWKGLALARLQTGLGIILLNTLKWYKIRCGQLGPMTLKPAA